MFNLKPNHNNTHICCNLIKIDDLWNQNTFDFLDIATNLFGVSSTSIGSQLVKQITPI